MSTPRTSPRTIRTLAMALSLALAAGAAFASDGDGKDIDKVNGAITAQTGQSYRDLSTVNGGISLEDGASVRDAETVNGGIKAGDKVAARGLETVNGGVRVGRQARLSGGINTVNGSIFVDRGGEIGKGVETVNGAIGLVGTDVAGDIETVNGDITVGIDSHVRGGIKVTRPTSNWMPINFGNKRIPRIIIGPKAAVDGDLVFEREVALYVHKTARIGKVTGAKPISYDTARAPSE